MRPRLDAAMYATVNTKTVRPIHHGNIQAAHLDRVDAEENRAAQNDDRPKVIDRRNRLLQDDARVYKQKHKTNPEHPGRVRRGRESICEDDPEWRALVEDHPDNVDCRMFPGTLFGAQPGPPEGVDAVPLHGFRDVERGGVD